MNPTLYFSVCSLFYCILLLVNLFSSKKKRTTEGNLLRVLAIINFVTLASEVFGIFLGSNYEKYKLLNYIVLKAMNIYYILFFSVFIIFILNISNAKKDISFKSYKYVYIIMAIASAINLALPINYNVNSAGVIVHSSGPAVEMIYYYVMLCQAFCLIVMFANHKKTSISNYSSLFVLIALTALVGIIQSYYPSLLLSASTNTFLLLYTYMNIVKKKFINDAKGESNDKN